MGRVWEGGSSDAAYTLIGLNRLWQAGLDDAALAAIAGRLGSDIPFFLYGPSSICTGRGEIVRPVEPPLRAKWVLLILPDIHMPTPAVYRRFDELAIGFDDEISREPDWHAWATRDTKDFLEGLVNDLERPAFELRPDLETLRSGIESKLRRPVRMSGSGSSLFTLFDTEAEAAAAAGEVGTEFSVRTIEGEIAPTLATEWKLILSRIAESGSAR